MEVANDRDAELAFGIFEAASLVMAYQRAASLQPDCEGGWLRMAAKHGARAKALLTEIVGESSMAAPSPLPVRRQDAR